MFKERDYHDICGDIIDELIPGWYMWRNAMQFPVEGGARLVVSPVRTEARRALYLAPGVIAQFPEPTNVVYLKAVIKIKNKRIRVQTTGRSAMSKEQAIAFLNEAASEVKKYAS